MCCRLLRPGWLPGRGWRAVAADDLPARASDLAGPVRINGQFPPHLVQHHVMMPPAVAFSGPSGWLTRRPGGAPHGAARTRRRAGRSRQGTGTSGPAGPPAAAGGQGCRRSGRRPAAGSGPFSPLPSRLRRRNEATPPGPETICRTVARIWCSSMASTCPARSACPARPACRRLAGVPGGAWPGPAGGAARHRRRPAEPGPGCPSVPAWASGPAGPSGPGRWPAPGAGGHTARTGRSAARPRPGPGRR